MADEVDKKDDAKQDKQPRKRRLLLIIVIVAGLALGGGAAAWLLLSNSEETQSAPTPVAPPPPTSALAPLDPFIVNLADPPGDRLFKVVVRAVVNDQAAADLMIQDEVTKARVRDRIISVLTAKMFQDVNNPTGKEALRRELAREINGVLPNDSVQEVLFVEFAIQ